MTMRAINRIGQKFGKLTVLRLGPNTRYGTTFVVCLCDCGVTIERKIGALVSGNTKSCGCLKNETKTNKTHGYSNTETYRIWSQMRQRCSNKKDSQYKYYGALGVRVCKRWESFEKFLKDMGERPKGKSLDRINSRGHYCKSNCRWASLSEQARNKRKSIKIKMNGQMIPLKELAEKYNMNYDTLRCRIRYYKWDINNILEPVRKNLISNETKEKIREEKIREEKRKNPKLSLSDLCKQFDIRSTGHMHRILNS